MRAYRTLTAKRFGPSTWDRGDQVPGAITEFEIEGSIQPFNARDIMLLPEGQRQEERWKLYSTTGDLKVADDTTGTLSDRVNHDGRDLVVISRTDWSAGGRGSRANHYKYILEATQTGPREVS